MSSYKPLLSLEKAFSLVQLVKGKMHSSLEDR